MARLRTRIKICGITRPEDGIAAADLGVDAIGLVFYPRSPRAVTPAQAVRILETLPAFVTVVGLFVNAQHQEVASVLEQVPLDLLQFHGEETEAYCRSFARPFIKALRVKPGADLSRQMNAFHHSQGLLLDAWHEKVQGGSGESFDWNLVPKEAGRLILAGGLSPDNVAKAIAQVQPYAVDVSSGVEDSPGLKSFEKMKRFVQEVNNV